MKRFNQNINTFANCPPVKYLNTRVSILNANKGNHFCLK